MSPTTLSHSNHNIALHVQRIQCWDTRCMHIMHAIALLLLDILYVVHSENVFTPDIIHYIISCRRGYLPIA